MGNDNFQIADSSLILAAKGYELLIQKRWAEAKDHLEKAIKLNQDLTEVYIYLWKIYKELGDEKKSKKYYKKAKKVGYKGV